MVAELWLVTVDVMSVVHWAKDNLLSRSRCNLWQQKQEKEACWCNSWKVQCYDKLHLSQRNEKLNFDRSGLCDYGNHFPAQWKRQAEILEFYLCYYSPYKHCHTVLSSLIDDMWYQFVFYHSGTFALPFTGLNTGVCLGKHPPLVIVFRLSEHTVKWAQFPAFRHPAVKAPFKTGNKISYKQNSVDILCLCNAPLIKLTQSSLSVG